MTEDLQRFQQREVNLSYFVGKILNFQISKQTVFRTSSKLSFTLLEAKYNIID